MQRSGERATSRAGLALATTVHVIVAELERRGLDADGLMALHQLDRHTLANALGRFPRARILAFVAAANAAAADPGLHVVASAAAEPGIFRLVDYLALMSPTVGLGLRAGMEAFAFVNEGVRFAIRETATAVVTELHAVFEEAPDALEVACTFVVIERRVRAMTHGHHGVEAVDLRAPEDGAGVAMRRLMPDTLFRFGASVDRLVIARAAWDSNTLYHHPVVSAVVRQAMASPIVHEVRDWLVVIEESIRAGLADGKVATVDVAVRLGTSERSLQRRLHERGTSFLALLERVRQSEAFRLLRASAGRDGIAAIAQRLGYSETSAFTRAFRRWTGQSPRAWSKAELPK